MTPSSPEMAGDISVVIVDDHAIVREGLRALVDAQAGMHVIAEAANGEQAWQRIREHSPDVVLLDLSMPGVAGAEAADRITREFPKTRIVALTMHEERGYVTRLLRAGAAAYVLKRSPADELVRAVRAVAAGGTYIDASLAGELLSERAAHADHSGGGAGREAGTRLRDLTPREGEVLRLVARGHTNKEIATALTLSVKTVETHKANGLGKLGLASRAALVRFAVDEGWLQAGGGVSLRRR